MTGHDYRAVEPRLRPGAWDSKGFLLPGEALNERIAADLETCARIGTSPEVIGQQMVELLAAAAGTEVGRPKSVGDFVVAILHRRGLMTCPWATDEFETCPVPPDGRPTANQFRIVRGGKAIEGFTLSAHLIGAHGFFGGTSTRFRIEPEVAATVLGTS